MHIHIINNFSDQAQEGHTLVGFRMLHWSQMDEVNSPTPQDIDLIDFATDNRVPSGTFYWTGYHESSCVRLKINLTNFSRTVHTKRVFLLQKLFHGLLMTVSVQARDTILSLVVRCLKRGIKKKTIVHLNVSLQKRTQLSSLLALW